MATPIGCLNLALVVDAALRPLAAFRSGPLQSKPVMATPGHFDNVLSRDDWLAILRCVEAEQERIDEEKGRLAPEHPHHAASAKAHDDLAALRAKLRRLIEDLGHAGNRAGDDEGLERRRGRWAEVRLRSARVATPA